MEQRFISCCCVQMALQSKHASGGPRQRAVHARCEPDIASFLPGAAMNHPSVRGSRCMQWCWRALVASLLAVPLSSMAQAPGRNDALYAYRGADRDAMLVEK